MDRARSVRVRGIRVVVGLASKGKWGRSLGRPSRRGFDRRPTSVLLTDAKVGRRALVGPLPATVDRIESYLVDPASSHMLLSMIKPCMSKYKRIYAT